MIRVNIFCEGQTEEAFVNQVLAKHFEHKGIYFYPRLFTTSEGFRGGITNYAKIKFQIEAECKKDSMAKITTLIDCYAFPKKFFPLPQLPRGMSSFDEAQAIEKAFQQDINYSNFIAYVSIHETEGLLFSNPQSFSKWFDGSAVEQLKKIANAYTSPEHINDGRETAPSKRIQRICKGYKKVFHGLQIAQDIGLEAMRKKCEHFDAWIKKLEQLA